MTIPMWMLLGFATWTLLLLIATVGVFGRGPGDSVVRLDPDKSSARPVESTADFGQS
jgi:hypothetical protein